ncbi:nuclear transport factor 2 family protein [Castellaniella sp. GW247-6E4]|uniref:nuclear transport factor 2 family protein n=1 Tax=Castellaniella sp. GW247-6E4 TaxID=3140380 RepID=UPI003315EE5F
MNSQDETQIAVLRNLYAKQAHLIDTGQHEGWAQTFTADGEFHSPTYGEPAIGHDQLADISRRFSESAQQAGERHRHVIENIWVTECDGSSAQVRAYVMIVGTDIERKQARILRIVTNIDQLEKSADGWLIRHRKVEY